MEENPVIFIVDAITGETIEREFTPEELADYVALCEATEQYQNEQDAKAAARESALAKLAELGLTEEEIGAL
jgi:predicted DNA-binding transcriptional regulator YafY